MIWKNVHKPDFFLVGAAKSGTTSLNAYLTAHPEIYMSPIKEPNYFSTDINPNNFRPAYKKTLPKNIDKTLKTHQAKEMQIAFVRDENAYAQLFANNKKMLTAGESSTSYLYSTIAAEKVKAYNPSAKIIMILRNPAERAYSHYTMAVQMGLATTDFRTAFTQDKNATRKGWGVSELYFELGNYAEQIKRYQKVFDQEQLLILLFDDLIGSPNLTHQKICNFLNVTIFAAPKTEAYNKGVAPKNPELHRILMQSGLKEKIKKVLPASVFNKIKQKQYKTEVESLKKDDRQYLINIYKDEILELQEILDRDLNNWIK